MAPQVNKEHYDFNKYVSIERWNSYYYQISEVTKLKDIKTILLIGEGGGYKYFKKIRIRCNNF